MHPATVFQQVHGWRRDLDDKIVTLLTNLDTFDVTEIGPEPSFVLETQPFATALIVYNEGEPLELAAIGVQVESEDAK